MPDLPAHLWNLSKLLLLSPASVQDGPDMKRLLRYTIATCYQKMNLRLTDPVSDSYIKALMTVKEFSFDPKLQRDSRLTEITNDRTFLKYITNNPAVVKASIPRITDLYKLHQDDADLELYTQDTCMEFHCLLIDLLNSFKESVSTLTTAADKKDYEDFKTQLKTTLSTGYALLIMIKGRALQMHLQTIEGLLMKIDRSTPVPNVAKKGEEGKEHSDSEDLNEELEEGQRRGDLGPKPLRKIYRDWLQLMVVHFHAVDVLFGYVTGQSFPFDAISIKILVPPTLDRKLLSMHELLTDEDISFPKLDLHMPGGPTNKDINDFISDTRKLSSQAKSMATYAKRAHTAWEALKYEEAIIQLKPIGDDEANNLIIQAKNATQKCPYVEDDLNSVASGILLLGERLRIKSDDSHLPFKFRETFPGALHCEACLASMLASITKRLTNGDKFYAEICREMQVDYPLRLFSVIKTSFLVIIGLWSSYRSIKMLLSIMPLLPLPLQVRRYEVHHTRLSSYHFSVHHTNMDAGEYCGFDGFILWKYLESGAR
jgi:hypothetical protein